MLTNRGFGSSHHHYHRARTAQKLKHHEEDEENKSESEEFLSFEGDGYESDNSSIWDIEETKIDEIIFKDTEDYM